jgi:hypothetical protein
MGTQSGASPHPFFVFVIHTMSTMAGAMHAVLPGVDIRVVR